MGNKENKSEQNVRIALGVILIINLFTAAGFLSNGGSMGYGEHSYAFLAAHFWASIELSPTIFYLLLFGDVVALFLTAYYLYTTFFSRSEVWRQYRMDTFFWAEWQWEYTWNGKITNLWCECEKCAKPMKPKVVPDGNDGVGVRFICNGCGRQSTTIKSIESESEALEKVGKKILRKIRVGKFRGAIESRVLEGDEEK